MIDATVSQSSLSDLRGLLRKTLSDFRSAATNKLSAEEITAAKAQLDTVEELIRRIETGYVWIALYGKVGVGKSSIGNSLIGDDVFEVGPLHDTTNEVHFRPLEQRKSGKFMLVDVPGVLGKGTNEQTAREEAQKAHGLILVLEGEPLGAELQAVRLRERGGAVHADLGIREQTGRSEGPCIATTSTPCNSASGRRWPRTSTIRRRTSSLAMHDVWKVTRGYASCSTCSWTVWTTTLACSAT